jgi:putative endonuclease
MSDRPAHLQSGTQAEAIAEKFLVRQGLRILQRNFRVKGGEIDLICSDGGEVVFVEVRLRTNAEFGGAAASVTIHKQRRLILAARHWLQANGECACRFDCVLLTGLEAPQIQWLRSAFSAD